MTLDKIKLQKDGLDSEKLKELEKTLQKNNYFQGQECSETDSVNEGLPAFNLEFKVPVTLEEFLKMNFDHPAELIDGEVFVMDSPSIKHQEIISYVFGEIYIYIKQNKGECHAFAGPVNVKLFDFKDDILVPDVLIVCDNSTLTKQWVNGAPDFVLEVTSPSTRSRDFNLKKNKYMEAGVREYWVIDTKTNRLFKYYSSDLDGVADTVIALEGTTGLRIYNNALQIDLDEIRNILE